MRNTTKRKFYTIPARHSRVWIDSSLTLHVSGLAAGVDCCVSVPPPGRYLEPVVGYPLLVVERENRIAANAIRRGVQIVERRALRHQLFWMRVAAAKFAAADLAAQESE